MTDYSFEFTRLSGWLDCNIGTVEAGINQSGAGQITRVYYEAYGNPADTIGQRDGTKPTNRLMLTLRAIDLIPFPNDKWPTVSFVGKDGTSFYLTQLNHVREYPILGDSELEHDIRANDDTSLLMVQTDDGVKIVGVDVSLAVPDDKRMSPQLKKNHD